MSTSYLLMILVIIPYLLGSIPFGLILTRLAGHGDIRDIGSGNIGATNVMRTGNKWLAALTLLLDGTKGAAAMIIPHSALSVYTESTNHLPKLLIIPIIVVMLGHIFPIWLKFKGGKGVATAIGVLCVVNPILAIALIVTWILVFMISKVSSLSAIIAFTVTSIVSAFISFLDQHFGIFYPTYMIVLTLMILCTHKDNINRLAKGEEHRWKK